MGEMYTTHAEEYANVIENNAYNGLYELPSTLALVGNVSNKTLLDLGCGPGVYAECFVRSGAKVTAVDLSEQMVELTRNRVGDAVTCYAQDLSLGLPREKAASFDCVVCPLMIHYIEDLVPFFKEIRRVLKKGGMFVFSTHHPLLDFEDDGFSNYYQVERITEDWDTVGQPVEVSFFRRSFTNLFDSLHEGGFVLNKFSEGSPSLEMKTTAPDVYEKLSRRPNFIFVRAEAR